MNNIPRKIQIHLLFARLDENNYVVLDEIFDHSTGKAGSRFQGATGTTLSPVTKEYYDSKREPEEVLEYIRDSWGLLVGKNDDETELEYAARILEREGDELLFDQSCAQSIDALRNHSEKFNEDDYPAIECVGGGRCFTVKGEDQDRYEETYNNTLVEVVYQAEAGSYELAFALLQEVLEPEEKFEVNVLTCKQLLDLIGGWGATYAAQTKIAYAILRGWNYKNIGFNSEDFRDEQSKLFNAASVATNYISGKDNWQ